MEPPIARSFGAQLHISRGALSPEDLHYTVGNAKYGQIWLHGFPLPISREGGLLKISEAGSEGSADRTRPVD